MLNSEHLMLEQTTNLKNLLESSTGDTSQQLNLLKALLDQKDLDAVAVQIHH